MQKYSNCRMYKKTRALLDNVRHRKFRWIGHILRQDLLLRDIIEGRMKGKATRESKRLQMLSNVISKSYEELKRKVEDRSWWKKRAS